MGRAVHPSRCEAGTAPRHPYFLQDFKLLHSNKLSNDSGNNYVLHHLLEHTSFQCPAHNVLEHFHFIELQGFQPANGDYQGAYRSKVAVLRAHGVSSRPPNWTPSPAAASKRGQKASPSDSGPEAVAVTRKKRSRRPRPQAQHSRYPAPCICTGHFTFPSAVV